jgi:hypothetical protein
LGGDKPKGLAPSSSGFRNILLEIGKEKTFSKL